MGSDFLHRLLQLKYPNLPQRITPFESQTMLEQLCNISPDYDAEIRSLSVPENLAKIDKVVQLPYVPPERQEKSQEELEKIAERKRAAGQRLIEQTRAMRQEKAEQNENDLKYYTLLKEWKDKEPHEAYLVRRRPTHPETARRGGLRIRAGARKDYQAAGCGREAVPGRGGGQRGGQEAAVVPDAGCARCGAR